MFQGLWFQRSILLLVGLQAFLGNITLSLFGETEGLYAIVTHTMMAAGDYLHLWLRGEPYFNKPPMFFWMQAGFVQTLGWSEAALRLPSALASIGTLWVTYALGCLLFSTTGGFWAALVVGTCYAGLWFGPLAIIDPVLMFFMTAGMYGLARAYFFDQVGWWYGIGCVSLALGAMVKTLHALALPILIFGIFLWIRRDTRPFRDKGLWCGLLVGGFLLAAYYAMLGSDFWNHFFLKENLQRMVAQVGDEEHSAWEAYWGKRPIHWYAYAIWFDLFPWSLIMPVGLLLLWKEKPWTTTPQGLWVLVWALGYFLAFSLVPEKHERYLLPLLPAIGLVVGYVYHDLALRQRLEAWSVFIRTLLGLAGMAYVVLAFLGPFLLQKKWFVSLDIIPFPIQICLSALGLLILWVAIKGQIRTGLLSMGVLGIAMTLTVTSCIIPGILAHGSPRQVYQEVRRVLGASDDPIVVFQSWDWRGDEDEFYWDSWHGHSRVMAENLPQELGIQHLIREVTLAQTLPILMTEEQLQLVRRDASELDTKILMQFIRSKQRIVLVSLEGKNRPD